MRLLERLVYAREDAKIACLLEETATRDGVDWLEALVEASPSRRGLGRRLEVVDDLLTWLEGLLPPEREPRGPETEWAVVARVPDGDGAVLDDGRRVRYLGIDAPEKDFFGRTDPYAYEARDLNQALVAGRQVRLERDRSDTDGHGRLLRYVWVGDTLVNAELVRLGAARAMPVGADRRHEALLARLERQARRARRGLWAFEA